MAEISLPNLDFLGENKVPVVAGALVLITALAIGRTMGKQKEEMGTQKVELIPAEGASWSDIIKRDRTGVWGVVGPGEPVPGPAGQPGEPGAPGTPGETAVVNADWIKISYKGKTGYVHAGYVQGTKVATPGSCLRFRAQPDYTSTVYDCIPHGTTLSIIASYPGSTSGTAPGPTSPSAPVSTPNQSSATVVKDGYTWVRVTYGGKTGYVANSYLSGSKVVNTGTDGLRLRSAPGLAAPVIGNIPNGSTVTLASNAAGEADINPGGRIFGFSPVPAPLGLDRTITVRKGDTLRSLANRGYGSPGWWELLARTNPDKREPVIGEKWQL